jgi:hypothetical protein
MKQMDEKHVLIATCLNHHMVLTRDARDVWMNNFHYRSITVVKNVRVSPALILLMYHFLLWQENTIFLFDNYAVVAIF